MANGRRILRVGLAVAAAVVVLGVGAAAVWLARFDPNQEKPRLIALVREATGHDLALNGPIRLGLSLRPTLEINDAVLANPPGFSGPAMVTLPRVDVRLRLLPLLRRRVEIDRLTLVRPAIRLEVNQQGQANWLPPRPAGAPAAPPPAAGAPPPTPAPPATSTSPSTSAAPAPATPASQPAAPQPAALSVALRDVEVTGGTVAWQNDRTGRSATLAVTRLSLQAAAPDAPLHLAIDAAYDGTPFTLSGDTGSLVRLQDAAATTPWPIALTLTSGAARLRVEGAMTQPAAGRGYRLAVSGSVPDLTVLSRFLPNTAIPPLHDVSGSLHLADQGGGQPTLTSFDLHVGSGDLGAWWPGLALDQAVVTAPAADQPIKLTVAARLRNQPLQLAGTLGPPALLRPGNASPFPVDVTLRGGGASVSARGTIAQPERLAGAALDVAAQVPDLAELSPLAGGALPAVKQIALAARVTDAGEGLAAGAHIQALRLTTAAGDLSGDVLVLRQPKPTVKASLTSPRLDADALLAGWQGAPAAATATGTTPPAGTNAAPAPPPLPKPEAVDFAHRAILWGRLNRTAADISLAVDDLRLGGTEAKGVRLHLVSGDGRLVLDPLVADLPAGRFQARVTADSATRRMNLVLHNPGLPLRPILTALGEPQAATGNLETYADLQGGGDTPHDVIAHLTGPLGLAVANGTVDNRVLGATLARVLQAVNALDLVGRGGSSELRCFAAKVAFNQGIGAVQDLGLGSSLLTMTGNGSINLRDDSLALLLKPRLRLAGTNLVVPVRLTGAIAHPDTRVDTAATAEDNAGSVAGAIVGNATPLGLLGGMLGAGKLLGGDTDICPAALALARGQAAPAQGTPAQGTPAQGTPAQGAAQPGAPAHPAAPAARPDNPAAILQRLFR
jgi:AsmA protein